MQKQYARGCRGLHADGPPAATTHAGASRYAPWLALPLLVCTTAVSFAAVEEIVVTTSRREENLQDVAVSVTALGGAQLEERGITDFKEIKNLAAGLYMEKPRNYGDTSIRLRGVGSAPNSGVDSSVGVLVDGVYQISPGTAFTELQDIERIEVLRGPQGTLFGRNTTSGVVNIYTKRPDTYEFSGKVQGVIGSYEMRELRGMVNIPLVEGQWALRATGFTAQRDGYTDNIFTKNDMADDDRHGGRVKLLWTPNDDLDILFSTESMTTQGDLSRNAVVYGVDTITNLPAWRNKPWQDLATSLGITLPAVSLGKAADQPQEFEDEIDRQILTIDWRFGNHSLQSITAYEQQDSFMLDDRDRTIMEISHLTSAPERDIWSQEFILKSEIEGPLSYLLGLYYQDEDLLSPTTIYNDADYVRLGGVAGPPTVSTTNRDNQSRAIFGTVNYDIGEWTLIGGLRFNSDKREQYSTLAIPGRALIVPTDANDTFREWTYTAKLQYHIDSSKMAYLSVDRGYKAGGFNRQNTSCFFGLTSACLSPDKLKYDEETTDNYEIGLKSEWLDGRLRVNGAVFYQTYEDYQIAQSLPAQSTVLISNASDVDSKGVEVDFAAALSEVLTLEGGIAYTDAEYDNFKGAPCSTPTQPGCVGGVQNLSHRRLDNSSLWSGNVSLTYRAPVPFAPGMTWFASGSAVLKSDAYLDVSLDEMSQQNGYTLYGARLGVEPDDGGWKVTFWGNNLADKVYSSFGLVDTIASLRYQGMPRTVGMTFDWFF